MSLLTAGTLMLELEDYCQIQELFWKTNVTVITVIVRIGRLLSFTRTLLGRPLLMSLLTSGTLMLELEDYCHLQKLFWKIIVTVIVNFRDSYIRIGRLLSFTRTLLEEHCHYHHCKC